MFPERSLKKSDHVLFCGGPALESDTTPCAVLGVADDEIFLCTLFWIILIFLVHPLFMFWHLLVYYND
jgi:hypothetical protein